jgi:hypothetical protein
MDRERVSQVRWLRRWLSALAVVWLVIACGGGVGTGGTGAFASGPITGFGSIVVNGVHFDESGARIEDDDGNNLGRSDLHLGTMVEVESGEIRDAAATASQVRIVSALIGNVTSVAANALVVNGQTVGINAGTVFDDQFPGGLAAIVVGRVVEVHGFVMPTGGAITATRIEPKDGATTFKFRGVVTALDTQARTFDLGGQHFSYSGQVGGITDLAIGALLRVEVAIQPNAQGRWAVTSVGRTGPGNGDRQQAKARGVITAFTSNASFNVDGFAVDASTAQIEGGPLASGLRVEVEGRLQAGVLIATSVKVEDNNKHDELELRGEIASINTAAKVFTISGHSERVSYARTDIEYDKGTEADLAVGRSVRATGLLSADGTLLEATRIRFDK